MGLLSKCALNEDTDDPSDWVGTDDDVWYLRWRIKVKHWFTFANRCPKGIDLSIVFFPLLYVFPFTVWFTGLTWWYLFPLLILPVTRKWRKYPKTLFAIRGKGHWRWEDKDGTQENTATGRDPISWNRWVSLLLI